MTAFVLRWWLQHVDDRGLVRVLEAISLRFIHSHWDAALLIGYGADVLRARLAAPPGARDGFMCWGPGNNPHCPRPLHPHWEPDA